jgi:predicted O-methyltransferase YrrM
MFKQLMTIYGKMSERECQCLCDIADAAMDTGPIVELGTFTGRSALLMAAAINDPSRIYTIDNYQYTNGGRHRPTAAKNIARAKAHGINGVHFIKGDTRVVPAELRGTTVAMLFIDSAHTVDQVARELDVWQPMLAPHAVIAFHDVGHPKFEAYGSWVREWVNRGVESGFLMMDVIYVETLMAVRLA